jgi:hypothetical protein
VKQTKKVQITIPQELYDWVAEQAGDVSLQIAPMINVLINEARKARANQKGIMAMFDSIGKMTPDEVKKLMMEGKEENRALSE